MSITTVPLAAKHPDGIPRVLMIGRISTLGQAETNIDASYEYVQEYLNRLYSGRPNIKRLGERASGMLVDRPTIRKAEELIASGQVDLVLAEDLSRIYRNPRHQYDFVQNAVDAQTRVICPGDNLDTSDDNWEVAMGTATLRHGLHIPDTRRRVRRTAIHSFHGGGMVQKVKFGYRKLTVEQAASGEYGPAGLRLAKLPEHTPIIREMKDRLLRGDSYEEIAGWLTIEDIEPGPYVTSGRWSARLVTNLLADPILAGTRTHGDTICVPIFRTGKHRALPNPEPETKFYPSLAHLTPEEHAEVRAEIERRRVKHPSKTKDKSPHRVPYRKVTKEEAADGRFGPKGLRIVKRPECMPVIREMKDRVVRRDKYVAIAEWLNAEGVKPGAYVESGRWTARLVVDLLDDPILSGTRTFRDTVYRPIFKTGKHKPTKNGEPETEHCPTLAHLTVEEHETVRREIARRREMHASTNGRRGNCRNVPRSRSLWPGQAATCAVYRAHGGHIMPQATLARGRGA